MCHKWYRLTLTSTHLRPPITWMCRGRPRNCAATAPPLKKACTASRCAKCLQGGQPRNRKRCTIRRCKCACPRYINIDEATASQTPAIPAAAHCQVRPPNPATAHSAPLREGIRLASPSDATWIKARVTAWVKALNHLTKQVFSRHLHDMMIFNMQLVSHELLKYLRSHGIYVHDSLRSCIARCLLALVYIESPSGPPACVICRGPTFNLD
ncbi:uncharacterized protein BJ212DRAFT_56002 [Suillus subaureus]|uniref:Uncharacterized protein n=1 Tax=Suillus subaureus TaxID=48587 RepID=A0A9P7JKE4_9AGAM|nr:uncharacterized protein BJ212DRAFT_56002 [Suillus subaureus]KAG1827486.1 hypothetical protein BJ212DRAFT_56002 [Suillus subaureus]